MEPCRRRNRHNRSNYREPNPHQRQMNNIAYQMPFNGRHETNQGTDIYHPKDYPQKLLSNMQVLRSKQKFCDVIITVNGKAFHCHKAFLASGSPYFEAMFSSGLVEEEQQTVEIHGITPEVFDLLLDFMYMGKIEIHQENVQDVLAAANMLELPDVVDACCNFLRKELHPSNCVGIYRFAELHSCTHLRLEAKRFIERFFPDVLKESEIYDLPKEMLMNFIRSEGLAIENENQVFQFTINWILKDASVRRKHIFDLIELIRLPVISEKQLDIAIEECPDLSLKVALTKLIQDHKTQMRLIQLDKGLGQQFDIRMQPRMCAKKYIYIIGGYNRDRGRSWDESHTLSLVEKLDVNKDQWTTIAPMRNSRSGHAVAVLFNVVYVLGGESDSMIYNSCEAYDPLSNEWTAIRAMSQTRSVLGACALDGYIYAIGGWVGAEIGDSIERYDPLTDSWTFSGRMKTARFAMGIVAHEGLIYVIGGLSELNEAMDMVESFNPVTGEWNLLARLITPRAHVGVCLLRDHIYAVGGTNSSRPCLSSVERYSIEENKWSEILPMKFHKAGACAAAVNGKLYVIGGRRGMDRSSVPMTLNDVEVYDPEKNEWRKSASISTGRCEAAVAVV